MTADVGRPPGTPDAAPAWRHARNVLCVRAGSLGSVLGCTPALRALRSGLAGRRLTLLTSPAGATIAPFVPAIDTVIACGDEWRHGGADEARLAAHLAARRFDAAVVFTSLGESASAALRLCRLAGVPLRLAHADRTDELAIGASGEDDGDRIGDPELIGIARHDVVRQLALPRHMGCAPDGLALSFVPRPADVDDARAALSRLGLDRGRRYLVLHPGARAPAHRYPANRWAEAVRGLALATGLPLVFTGDAGECALVETIRAGCGVPTHSLAGELALGPFGALIRMAALLVCGNTGPAQIAAAVGTPVVSLYALTRPQTTPWHVRSRVLFHDVPCRFCHTAACPLDHHACLADVRPASVVDAVVGLLAAGPRRSGTAPMLNTVRHAPY